MLLGISLFPGYGQTAEELSLQAEAALRRARREGCGNCRYFSED
jgi:predicted signal transduction protein with EAL and GGDEF domain